MSISTNIHRPYAAMQVTLLVHISHLLITL